MAVTGDTATFVTATGPRATRIVPTVDAIEPELVGFVRSAIRWLDPNFPQKGTRGEKVRGDWKDDQEVETEFTQVEELSNDGRGIRIIRVYRMTPPAPPWEGAVRVIVLGAAAGARLELRWNFIATESEIRGTSAELTVEGPRQFECIADFQSWFETPGN
jgi:hypothetical protein